MKDKPDIKALDKTFNGNLDLMLFYLTWIKCGMKANTAYKELNPEVTEHSARTLGARKMDEVAKVDKTLILSAYGLDHEAYFKQLADGLKAERSDMTGQVFLDHKTRAIYHLSVQALEDAQGD